VILRIGPLAAAILFAAAPAFAADNYQTDIGPTPKNGRQGANVQGRGTVLATLDTAPHLLIYSPGDAQADPEWWRPWMSRWPAATAQRYDAYRAALEVFPVLFDTGGPAQRLLWTGPVHPFDRMVLAAVPPIAIPRETR